MAEPVRKVNLAEAFSSFEEAWSPRVAAALNGQEVRLVKLRGPFVWHRHAEEDELFLVVAGQLRMELRDGGGEREPVTLEAGEFCVVPRGVEHRPVAEEEAHVVLFEPASTRNTGEVEDERTVRELKRLDVPAPAAGGGNTTEPAPGSAGSVGRRR